MLQRVDQTAQAAPGPGRGPLRVLIASYRSHPHVGGQGVYVREASRALVEAGCAVDVASGPPFPELDPRVGLVPLPSLDLFAEANALKALRPRHFRSWADISEYLAHNTGGFGEIAAFGRRLRRYLRAHPGRYDVVHDNQSLCWALPRIAADGTPVVATLHHPITRDFRIAMDRAEGDWAGRLLLRRWHSFLKMQARTARRLPHILCVSEAARRAAIEDFRLDPARLSVAWNGVDHRTFFPDPSVPRDPNLIVTAASADVPLKGLDVLVAAFARIAARHPDARLAVIGRLRDGPAKRALGEAGLEGRVDVRSGLETAEVADLYRRAGIVACPSLFEGFGFPAAEAMACGAPVVASTGGALPEVVGEAGVIVPAADAGALAGALSDLLADPARRAALSAAGPVRAQACFRWSDHARAALALYARAGAPAPC